MSDAAPIVYIRGYAGTQGEVEQTVDDPTYGFNAGSTHIRLGQDGKADFYMFVSPFARLLRDHGYQDVIDGAVQQLPPDIDPNRTIWIYRYYDPTSHTFDRPGGRRLSIEGAAAGLRDFILLIRQQITQASTKRSATAQNPSSSSPGRVHIIAHSMGGLVARCLIQKIYSPGEAEQNISKVFTYGTPHGGIHFDIAGGGVLERLRDFVGFNDSDNFGPQKMYKFLTRDPGDEPPRNWDPRVIDQASFDSDRIFCVIGTNAEDYVTAAGLSRAVVGPQSDGLVQIDNAYVHGAHRAYIHRSHSGRYGMVNSEEGYQNLQRFLFGDFKITAFLADFDLEFGELTTEYEIVSKPDSQISYFVETQISVRGLPILMHERTLKHYCAEPIDAGLYKSRYCNKGNRLPLFTNFLFQGKRTDGTIRYMIRLALFKQVFRDGLLIFGDHLERLPLWSDYLIVELTPRNSRGNRITRDNYSSPEDRIATNLGASYSWASESSDPTKTFDQLDPPFADPSSRFGWRAPLVGPSFGEVLGTDAAVVFEGARWN